MHERFNGPGSFDTVTLHPDRLSQPLRWRKPARVFVNSMSDLFEASVPDEYIVEVFDVMANARRHSFQLLTKRHARMRSFVTRYVAGEFGSSREDGGGAPAGVLPNVWLGVSVESQKWADIRIPALLDTPAAVRFLSCEPLLGPVMLPLSWLHREGYDGRVDWIIVGGESGPGARPMHPDWARTLRDQCQVTGTPFLFKQWGAWAPATGGLLALVGKKAAGRELDGRTWDEYPTAVIPA
jgi:protein gp37